MAFMGILAVNAALIIIVILFIINELTASVFLVIGIVQAVRKKKSMKVFFIIAGVLFALPLLIYLIISFVMSQPKSWSINTPDGAKKVPQAAVEEMLGYIEDRDAQNLDRLLDEYPALAYFSDNNSYSVLIYAAKSGSNEAVETIIRHGGVPDAPTRLIYKHTLEFYYLDLEEDKYNVGEILEITRTLLENGASVALTRGGGNVLFFAGALMMRDGKIDDCDIELVELLHSYGAEYDAEYYDDTLLKRYSDTAEYNNVERDENYDKLFRMIRSK